MRIILTSAAACSLLLGVLAATNAGGQRPEQKTGLKLARKLPCSPSRIKAARSARWTSS